MTAITTTTEALTFAPEISSRVARYATTVARVLLGLGFFVFGLNGFLNFIPPPSAPPPEGAMSFAIALAQTGYMFPLIKGTETLAGLLLLTRRCVPLALILLAPVLVNIIAFHVFLAPSGSAIAFALVGLELFVAWSYRRSFRTLFAS